MVDNESEEDSDVDPNVVVYTSGEIMRRGLLLVNYTRRRIKRAKKWTNEDRFVTHFGSHPLILAEIFEDLQRSGVEEAFVPPQDANLDWFLMAMHHLKCYPTEKEREPIFDVDRMKGRDWVWYFLEKIQALKAIKICWPEDNFGSDIWVITVDGTHCWISEPGHPEWSMDSDYYSHKYGKAGVDYELAISISTNQLVWINGPFPAGTSDLKVFKKPGGLRELLTSIGKRGIADGGYPGYPRLLSTPNSLDSKEVKKFKSRALKRHETFNGMTKRFNCLSGRFRHSVDRFGTCFEAICVICQYQIEKDPLYDVLIDGVF